MTYWLKGNGNVEYTIGGVRTPRGHYSEDERRRGRKSVRTLTEMEYQRISKTSKFQELLNSGELTLSTRPLESDTPSEPVKTKVVPVIVDNEKNLLLRQNEMLLQEAENARNDMATLQNEINHLRFTNEDLQTQIAKQTEILNNRDTEIADLNSYIESLKSKKTKRNQQNEQPTEES